MRFLCVCEGGIVRSGAMAYQLKRRGHDAIPFSWRWNKPETLALLVRWADRVIVMQEVFVPLLRDMLVSSDPESPDAGEKILSGLEEKACVVDVGEDGYHNPLHGPLNEALSSVVDSWGGEMQNVRGATIRWE